MNLLNNAAKYTPRGGHVVVHAKPENDEAIVRMCDDGVGFPKDMLDSAFDLFVQSRRTLDRADGGLGLGLTLVRGLVKTHGGTVVAHSDGEGKGSELVVKLPLASPPSGAIAEHKPLGTTLTPGSRVGVIEDNADNRDVMCALLTRAGFDCKSCDSGLAGLKLIEEFAPQAAFIDIGLPELDGLELARRARASGKHPKIYLIALTGYGQREDKKMTFAAGFDEHLVKPVDLGTMAWLLGTQIQDADAAKLATPRAAAALPDGAAE